MAKKFARRKSKRERKTIDLPNVSHREIFKSSDQKLLRGAKLQDIRLSDITVKEQVRTKFNDKSIKELAENIRANGLIQPLVLHREGKKYVLICGERRFRAMSSIKMEEAPCFILENKTSEELMAIQFSENSAREDLHYIDKADGILNYQMATKASERKIVAALGISKSEVHRSLLIARLPLKFKEAAKKFNIEKYVLVEWDALEEGDLKKQIEDQVVNGEIVKRAELKKMISSAAPSKTKKKTTRSGTTKTSKKAIRVKSPDPKNMSAEELLKLLSKKKSSLKIDKKTRDALKDLVSG